MDCIFCKIINKTVPSYKIYEDEYTYAFLDIADDLVGHTLVVPKIHCKNMLDCPNNILHKVIDTVKLISNHYVSNCGYDGVDIINANNESAEQSVFHLHFHILPRLNNDNLKIYPKLAKQNSDLKELQQKLKIN